MIARLSQILEQKADVTVVALLADLPAISINLVELEERLAQVIINLITNTISFCSVRDVIWVWVWQWDNRFIVVVEDTGPWLSNGWLQKYLGGFLLIGRPAILEITQVLGLLFPSRLSRFTVALNGRQM